jgi:hypothetical protein
MRPLSATPAQQGPSHHARSRQASPRGSVVSAAYPAFTSSASTTSPKNALTSVIVRRPGLAAVLALLISILLFVLYRVSGGGGGGDGSVPYTERFAGECFTGCRAGTRRAADASPPSVPYRVLVVVVSKCSHVRYRETIRATWASKSREGHDFVVRFLLGGPSASDPCTPPDRLEEDVVVLDDVPETYANLPRKMLGLFLRLAPKEEGGPVGGNGVGLGLDFVPDIVVKVDDDVYLDAPRLFLRLNEEERRLREGEIVWKGGEGTEGRGDRHPLLLPQTPIYAGFFYNSTRVSKDPADKWVDPDYPFSVYPSYAGGGAYWLTWPTVRFLADCGRTGLLPTHWANEDASLGTWLAGANLVRIHDEGYLRCLDCAALSHHQAPWAAHLSTVSEEAETRWSGGGGLKKKPTAAGAREERVVRELEAIHARVSGGDDEEQALIRGRCCGGVGGLG